ncbi:GumC family protein [Pedobacter sp. N23S346]|uniref:GumC family protein n=1 Tax=Pedobacter sp. N23S346 TaxID=3402750 RepID=UPI003AC76F35
MNNEINNQFQMADNQEKNILGNMVQRFLPFWPLFLLSTLITLTCTFLYLHYTSPIFKIDSKILVKDEKKGVDAGKILDALNIFGEKKIVENEIEIIRSAPLIQKVIKQLDLYVTQVHEGRIRKVEWYGKDAPLKIYALDKEDLPKSLIKLNVSVNFKQKTISINNKNFALSKAIKIQGHDFVFAANPDYIAKDNSGRTEDLMVIINPLEELAKSLQEDIKAEASSKQSSVISISMEESDPEKGKKIINALFGAYNEAAIEDKNVIAVNTLRFVDERLKLITRDLESVEQDIKDFKSKEGIFDISAQGQIYLETVKDNDEKLSQVNLQLLVLKDVENYINGKKSNAGISPSLMGIDDVALANLLTKLFDVEAQLSRIDGITGKQNYQQQQLNEELKRLKKAILENINNIRTNLKTSANSLDRDINASKGMLKQIPGKEKALIDISRQQEIKNGIYTFLLQKREETALSYASAAADSRLIEPASASSKPVKPKKVFIYFIGLALGIGISVGLVWLKEGLMQTVMFREELEQRLPVPILGELSYNKNRHNLVVAAGSRSVIAEQFRALRINLSYLGLGKEDKIIQVSSSIPGEGKSFVAQNLAIAMSLIGKKVLLLELDLRRPKLIRGFPELDGPGLTDYLIDTADIDGIIQQAKVNGKPVENLSLISSGGIPPNPTELIGSEKFSDLMEKLKNKFDYIIVDTPPISLVSDALVFAKFSSVSLYVVRHEYTPTVYLKFIRQLIDEQKLKKLTIVFNSVKQRGMGGYGGNYGYGYGYGYGYDYSAYTEEVTGLKNGFFSFFRKK